MKTLTRKMTRSVATLAIAVFLLHGLNANQSSWLSKIWSALTHMNAAAAEEPGDPEIVVSSGP